MRVISTPDGDGVEVYSYDKVDFVSPIKVDGSGAFIEILVPYTPSFVDFYRSATEMVATAPARVGAPEPFVPITDDTLYTCVSATPNLYFTSIKHTRQKSHGVDEITLMNVGKVIMRDGHKVMPIAISIHHGLADGGDVNEFFAKVQHILDTL